MGPWNMMSKFNLDLKESPKKLKNKILRLTSTDLWKKCVLEIYAKKINLRPSKNAVKIRVLGKKNLNPGTWRKT